MENLGCEAKGKHIHIFRDENCNITSIAIHGIEESGKKYFVEVDANSIFNHIYENYLSDFTFDEFIKRKPREVKKIQIDC